MPTTIKLSNGAIVTYDGENMLSHWRGFSKYRTTEGQVIGVCSTCVIGPLATTGEVDGGIIDFYANEGAPRTTYDLVSGKPEE